MDSGGVWIVNAFEQFTGKSYFVGIDTRLEALITNPRYRGFVDGLFKREKVYVKERDWDGNSVREYKTGYRSGEFARVLGIEPNQIKPSQVYATQFVLKN